MVAIEAQVQPMPKPIPVPANFPVQWTQPDDPQLFWAIDRMHAADQQPPLSAAVWLLYDEGFNRAAEVFHLPIRARTRYINTYLYQTFAPLMLTPDEMEALGKQGEEKVGAVMGRLGAYWDTDLLPVVQEHLAAWADFDLKGASRQELAVHLDDTVRRFTHLWEIHFRIAVPFLMSLSLFDDFYRDLFGSEDAFGAQRLLQGIDNKSVEGNRALWNLSRLALTMPAVRRVLEEQAATAVISALEQSAEGQAFLAELRAYLDEYGQRGGSFISLSEASWIEDPTPVIKNLKDYITQPDRDLVAEMEALAAEREQRLADVRAQLAGYPQPVIDQFEFLLTAAQVGNRLQEDHNFWIDQRGVYRFRCVLVECGHRLASAGVIEHPDDVFYLPLDELRAALMEVPAGDRRAVVAGQKAIMEHFRTIVPPPVLGAEPPGPPPDSPVTRAINKFFGGPPQPATEPGTLKGNAGSPGTVRGVARVVRSLAEAAKLQPGDILVAETTAPPWTPLFATAAAVITDTGGILSHCAIVAREYAIPAVVGIGIATAVIQDGQILEVDGDAGIVRILG